jgi:long-chain acyl-CoA synthetase
VSEAAVFGLPDRVLGEVVGAAVCLRAGLHVDEAALQEFVGARLVAHKVPVRIDFHDAPLPRNAAGKLLKKDLRR